WLAKNLGHSRWSAAMNAEYRFCASGRLRSTNAAQSILPFFASSRETCITRSLSSVESSLVNNQLLRMLGRKSDAAISRFAAKNSLAFRRKDKDDSKRAL